MPPDSSTAKYLQDALKAARTSVTILEADAKAFDDFYKSLKECRFGKAAKALRKLCVPTFTNAQLANLSHDLIVELNAVESMDGQWIAKSPSKRRRKAGAALKEVSDYLRLRSQQAQNEVDTHNREVRQAEVDSYIKDLQAAFSQELTCMGDEKEPEFEEIPGR
jgi:hypothetical protein